MHFCQEVTHLNKEYLVKFTPSNLKLPRLLYLILPVRIDLCNFHACGTNMKK